MSSNTHQAGLWYCYLPEPAMRRRPLEDLRAVTCHLPLMISRLAVMPTAATVFTPSG